MKYLLILVLLSSPVYALPLVTCVDDVIKGWCTMKNISKTDFELAYNGPQETMAIEALDFSYNCTQNKCYMEND